MDHSLAALNMVYPRACGGTADDTAGSAETRVYPRACGGTASGPVWP